MAEKTYLQAISDGLRQEMRRDERVFVLGEDVGVYGGAFKVTLGFQEEFGAWRVIDMPLSETAIVGGATGAAIMGLRPVAEMQFADFVSCAWDHLVTVAAKQRWRAGTPVPIVLRLPSGGGFSGGPFHSQNPESSFAHIPGLKCVCPATPEDAKGLIISAIEDPNPVLFFEHKHLYRRIKGEVPDERYTTPIGKARIHQEGDDVTVITWGAMVYTAEEAAKTVDASVEIVDLRTIMPWDKQAVLDFGAKDVEGARAARGHPHRRLRRRDRGHDRRGGVRGPRRAGEARRRARHAGAVLARAREGIHPAGGRRRQRVEGVDRVLMASTTAVDVVMPQMGVSVSEGTITKWSKSVGDTIEADETLLEISTDKVDTEVPSPATGVVTEILVQEGETVEVGTVLARIGGERAGRCRTGRAARAADAACGRRVRRSGDRRSGRARAGARCAAPAAQAPQPAAADNGKAFVSPVVARIAAEHGIDPSQVPGTGTGGRVTKKDILALRRERRAGCARAGARSPGTACARSPRRRPLVHRPRRRLRPPRKPAPAPVPRRSDPRRRASRSSRCRRCGAGSPSTCAARSTRPRTSRRRSRST